jgi:glycosyltransferase involved in cell wall biosynthesis
VATEDALTLNMAGPAIRAWHIARALSAEHEVVLVTTSGRCELASDAFSARTATNLEIAELERWSEIVIVQGFILHAVPALAATEKVMVVDIYDPQHLEQLALVKGEDAAFRRDSVRTAVGIINHQLARGDFFLCASSKQRDFWLGALATLGRVNPPTYDQDEMLEGLIQVVPFGLPDEPPRHSRPALKGVIPGIDEGDEVLLWGGGIYNWFDPLTLIRAVYGLRSRRPRLRLLFMGLRHPNPAVLEMQMAVEARRLADSLGLTNTHVFFNDGWVPYDERQNYLLEADIGVSTHLQHLESAYSFRTRILDYIWAALPIVATEGDALSGLIERETLGITVPAGDVTKLQDALTQVLDDQTLAAACRANLACVRPDYTWSQVLNPLVRFCRSPRRAADIAQIQETALDVPIKDGLEASRQRAVDPPTARERLHTDGIRGLVHAARSRMKQMLPRRSDSGHD